MLDRHRRYAVDQLIKAIEAIGPDFEAFGTKFLNWYVQVPLTHRGLSVLGHPVKAVLDSTSSTGEYVAEYSTEAGYFQDFEKPLRDLRNARTKAPQARFIFLVTSQTRTPTAVTRSARIAGWVRRLTNATVEFVDGRRIAEEIVSRLLQNERAVQDLEQYLEPLRRIRTEYVASNLIPEPTPWTIERPIAEDWLNDALNRDRVVALTGISGAGKTDLAAAVARARRVSHDMVIWLRKPAIHGVEELQDVDVSRSGQRMNVLSLLQERSCLLVLDDLQTALTVEELKRACGERSEVLITRQSSVEPEVELQMPPLGRDDSRLLLEMNIGTGCSDELFEEVWTTVGGHPLALRLLNAAARSDGWDALAEDLEAIGRFNVLDRTSALAEKLLSRWYPRLECELAFFEWCDAPRVDLEFARAAIKPRGVRALAEACLLAPERGDLLRLHDVVVACVKTLAIDGDKWHVRYESALERYVQSIVEQDDSRLALLNVSYTHQRLFESLIRKRGPRDAFVYCLLHTWADADVDPVLIGDPVERAAALTRQSEQVSDLAASVPVEMVEALYRHTKKLKGWEAAQAELRAHLEVFRILKSAGNLSEWARSGVHHHEAKALKNLGERAAAAEIWEELVASPNAFPASKALYARLLAERAEGVPRAHALLLEVLEGAATSPPKSGLSVTLAAIEDLGKSKLKKYLPDVSRTLGDVMAKAIIEASSRGFEQGFVAFAAIGRYWSFNEPERFMNVFRKIPPRRPIDVSADAERAAWGEILIQASKLGHPDEREPLLRQAVAFLEAIERKTAFTERHRGHALSLLGQHDQALEVLSVALAEKPDPWLRHRYSQALLGVRRHSEALAEIEQALVGLDGQMSFRSAFLEQRYEVRAAMQDPGAFRDLEEAIEICESPKYAQMLREKLDAVRGGDGA